MAKGFFQSINPQGTRGTTEKTARVKLQAVLPEDEWYPTQESQIPSQWGRTENFHPSRHRILKRHKSRKSRAMHDSVSAVHLFTHGPARYPECGERTVF